VRGTELHRSLIAIHGDTNFEWAQMFGRQAQRSRVLALLYHHGHARADLIGPCSGAHWHVHWSRMSRIGLTR
jgi:hypothetical protein